MKLTQKNQNVPSANYDEQLLAKYTESGGNPRDFVWKGILSSFTTLECPLPELTSFEPPPSMDKILPSNSYKGRKNKAGGGQHPWR